MRKGRSGVVRWHYAFGTATLKQNLPLLDVSRSTLMLAIERFYSYWNLFRVLKAIPSSYYLVSDIGLYLYRRNRVLAFARRTERAGFCLDKHLYIINNDAVILRDDGTVLRISFSVITFSGSTSYKELLDILLDRYVNIFRLSSIWSVLLTLSKFGHRCYGRNLRKSRKAGTHEFFFFAFKLMNL